jgi:predicted acyl esterase
VSRADKRPAGLRVFSTSVATDDGVLLATDVYLPESTDPADTVLIRLPYDKTGRYTFVPQVAIYLAHNGFAVVTQDVRGKFLSGGRTYPFVNEAKDGGRTLTWIAEQSWSTGRVGMIGDSYYGFTQWAAASTRHSALRAIVPRVTGTALAEVFSSQGVPRLPFYEWVLQTFSGPSGIEERLTRPGDSSLRPPEGTEAAVAIVAELQGLRAGEETMTAVFGGPRPSTQINIPALHVGGWWDNLQHAQLMDWEQACGAPGADHQFLRMGITDHEDYQLRPAAEGRTRHQGDDAELAIYLPRMLDEPISFLRHYLGGSSDQWDAPTVRFEVAHGGWRESDLWPPADATTTVLHLGDGLAATQTAHGGTLTPHSPAATDDARWWSNPADPVPCPVPDDWGILFDLPDESALHTRNDVATFTTPPMTDVLEIIGSVRAELECGSPCDVDHLILRLLDVGPAGSARLIREGATVLTPASDGTQTVAFELGSTAYRVMAGHSLRLAISGTLFPLYSLGPVVDGIAGSPSGPAHEQRVVIGTSKIILGGR